MPDHHLARPVPLTLAATLVTLQGLALVALAVVEMLNVVPERASVAVSTSLFFVVYGAALVACGWGLIRVASWARGPVLLTQLIQLGVAWNLRDHVSLAVPLALVALITLVAMLQRASIAALMGEMTADDD